MADALDDYLEVGIQSGQSTQFRLLVRQSLLEFYLAERLVQCYSLPPQASGRLGLVFESGQAGFDGFRAWDMDTTQARIG